MVLQVAVWSGNLPLPGRQPPITFPIIMLPRQKAVLVGHAGAARHVKAEVVVREAHLAGRFDLFQNTEGAETEVRPAGIKGEIYAAQAVTPPVEKTGAHHFTLNIIFGLNTGAEKLRESVAEAFKEKFGVSIIEEYGATEMAPVISCNAPDFRAKGILQKASKPGSVGLPFPGLSAKVIDPEDFDEELPFGEEGMLLVRGPNQMLGYLKDKERTEEVLHNGWYITGDIAKLDGDGFIRIVGRLSRFSKIGGEMVPHVQIEETLQKALGFEEQMLVVTSVADASKGEKLVVLHLPDATPKIEPKAVTAKLKEAGLPNLWIPKEYYETPEFPLLGSGKLDLRGLTMLASEIVGAGKKG